MLVTPLSIYPGSEIHTQVKKEKNIIYDDNYFETLTDQGSLNLSECYSNHYSKIELFYDKFRIYCFYYWNTLLFCLYPFFITFKHGKI